MWARPKSSGTPAGWRLWAQARLRIMRRLLAGHPEGLAARSARSWRSRFRRPPILLEKPKSERLLDVRRQGAFPRYRANTAPLRGRPRFLHAECRARAKAIRPGGDLEGMRVLVLCTGNSARSQMAEAFLRSFDPAMEVHSAGTEPAARVSPHAVEVMREVGVDLAGSRPKPVTDYLGQAFDFVITVCAEADRNCPVFRGPVGRRVHLPFEDPARAAGSEEQVRAVFRRVRDEIRERLRDFYEQEMKPER